MISSPLTPRWVSTKAALADLVHALAGEDRIAVDTESNSLHAYQEQVCLIQFSTPTMDSLVDPLAIIDLSPLAPIFASTRIEKYFHAAEYDLACLKRDYCFEFNNIFDTMQSARILGYQQVGLDALLAQKFDVKVNKRFQKADWAKRPLPEEQILYACQDTHYLLGLGQQLHLELEKVGRWDLAREEFDRLTQGNENRRGAVPAWQRISGTHTMSGEQRAILRELCEWRDALASRLDRPPFKIMDDKRLIAIAIGAPADRRGLEEYLTIHQIDRFGRDILHAVAKGRTAKSLDKPRSTRPSAAFSHRMDRLTQWRKATAIKHHLESDIILPKNWMHAIAENNPCTQDELEKLMPNSPWRLKTYGPEILKIISARNKKKEAGNAH